MCVVAGYVCCYSPCGRRKSAILEGNADIYRGMYVVRRKSLINRFLLEGKVKVSIMYWGHHWVCVYLL